MNCCIPDETFLANPPETSLECDYDKNVTNLYDAIEKGAWDSIMSFLTSQKWSFVSFQNDPQCPEAQVRTWVTRFDQNGHVRWSQLPLHAAIIFHAPQSIVEALIELYPLSVQCTDDQRMLPLHLAVRVGANDGIMNLLIQSFPGALQAKNQSGRLPYYVDGSNVRKDYTETMQQIVKHTTQRVAQTQRSWSQKTTDNLKGTMEEQGELVRNLEYDKDTLEHRLIKAKREISFWKKKCRDMEKRAGKKQMAKYSRSEALNEQDATLGLLEQSRKLIELVGNFDKEKGNDTDSTSDDDSSSEESSFDPKHQLFKELPVKSANDSVASSVNLNSIHHRDVCWKEMRQHIYNSPNQVTRYERRKMAPVTEGNNLQEDAYICWNELRETIGASKEETRESKISRIKKKRSDIVMQASADKLLKIIPKDNEKRESPEKSVNPKRAITPKRSDTPKRSSTPKRSHTPKRSTTPKRSDTPKRSTTPKEQRQSKIPTKDLKTLRALRLERERRQSAEVSVSSKERQRGKTPERPIRLDKESPTKDSSRMKKRLTEERNRRTERTVNV